MDRVTSRFVAGALCPSCAAQDRVVLDMVDGTPQQRRCVACGFAEAVSQTEQGHNSGVIPGRLERTRDTSEQAVPVQIMPAQPAVAKEPPPDQEQS